MALMAEVRRTPTPANWCSSRRLPLACATKSQGPLTPEAKELVQTLAPS